NRTRSWFSERNAMRRILVAIIAAALVVLAAVLIIRTNRFQSRQLAVEPIPPLLLDTTAAAERLAGALRFRTISNQDSTQFDAAEFRRFQDYLRTSFPRLHARPRCWRGATCSSSTCSTKEARSRPG